MKARSRVVLCFISACFAILLLCFLWTRHAQKVRKIPTENISYISSIYILTKENGVEEAWSVSKKDISSGLEADIIQCIEQFSMTTAQISTSPIMEISDSYIYVSIWIFNMDGTSFRVNISNDERHSSVQFDEKHFGMINSSQMLNDVKSILMSS